MRTELRRDARRRIAALAVALALAAPADETAGSNRSGGVSRALARGATPSVPAATPISTEEQR